MSKDVKKFECKHKEPCFDIFECYVKSGNEIARHQKKKKIYLTFKDVNSVPEILEKYLIKCECGGTKANTTHSDGCPVGEYLRYI